MSDGVGGAPVRRRWPTRRAAFTWTGGAIAAAAAFAGLNRAFGSPRGTDDVRPAVIRSEPLGPLLPEDPGRRRFGDLVFRSGIVMTSDDPGFGGLSALWRSVDGTQLVSLSDNAQWLTASVLSHQGLLIGLADAVMAPILGEDGVPLRQGPAFDTESLAISEDGVAYIGIERVHEVRRFSDWSRDGVRARGIRLPMPREAASLPANRSFEAVAVAPPRHRLAGAVVAIAEGEDDDATPAPGWVLTGESRFAFRVLRSNGYAITDMRFLPSGELLLLERHYSVLRGVGCRMRRVPAEAIVPGARVDGRIIFEADRRHAIDNMEGLAIHRDPESGETVLTLVSDDNFSSLQRTLLLEFTLPLS